MPKLLPAFAARTVVVAAVTTAAALGAVLPATEAAAPAVTSTQTASLPAAFLPAAILPPAPVTIPVVSTPVVPVALAAPARGALRVSALNTALDKIGSPYRWGSAGPDAFDCSGLVKWSFAQAGLVVPRTSSAQSVVGTPVAKADLQPGDLVFFYSPVSHVAIYIGGGQVVHASTSSSPVKISNLSAMPFHNARRV